ncbi:MAG: type II secretion system major pseudopilin GspG [Myxococcota bacterium]
MQTRRKHRRRVARGMTLIEIMVVITLLGLIAAAVGVSAMGVMTDGQRSAARTQAMELAKAVDTYKVMFGRYPSTSEGLAVLTASRSGGAPILERVPRDPWGGPYEYVIPGARNASRFDVRSKGPDGQEGGGDDVGNWPEEER